MDVVEGGVMKFEVVARNKFGTRVSVSDALVVTSPEGFGSATVDADGKNGVFTAATGVAGAVMLTPSAGGLVGLPFPVSVVPDNEVASVTIEPSAPDVVVIEPQPPEGGEIPPVQPQ